MRIGFTLLLLLPLACSSGNKSDGDGAGGTTSTGGTAGASTGGTAGMATGGTAGSATGGSSGAGAAGGSAGAGTGGTAGAGGGGAGAAGMAGQAGSGGVCNCPGGAPVPGTNTADTPPRAQEVIIFGVDTENDVLVLRNVSGSSIDVGGWWLCRGVGSYQQLPSPARFSRNLTIRITEAEPMNPEPDTVYLDQLPGFGLRESQAIALYRTPTFDMSDQVEAYAYWEQEGSPTGPPRFTEAEGSGLWSGGPVMLSATGTKFIATGDVTQGMGFTEVPDLDMVLCCP